jgi:hypothetical protein
VDPGGADFYRWYRASGSLDPPGVAGADGRLSAGPL